MYFLEVIFGGIGGLGFFGLVALFFNDFDIGAFWICIIMIAVGVGGLTLIGV